MGGFTGSGTRLIKNILSGAGIFMGASISSDADYLTFSAAMRGSIIPGIKSIVSRAGPADYSLDQLGAYEGCDEASASAASGRNWLMGDVMGSGRGSLRCFLGGKFAAFSKKAWAEVEDYAASVNDNAGVGGEKEEIDASGMPPALAARTAASPCSSATPSSNNSGDDDKSVGSLRRREELLWGWKGPRQMWFLPFLESARAPAVFPHFTFLYVVRDVRDLLRHIGHETSFAAHDLYWVEPWKAWTSKNVDSNRAGTAAAAGNHEQRRRLGFSVPRVHHQRVIKHTPLNPDQIVDVAGLWAAATLGVLEWCYARAAPEGKCVIVRTQSFRDALSEDALKEAAGRGGGGREAYWRVQRLLTAIGQDLSRRDIELGGGKKGSVVDRVLSDVLVNHGSFGSSTRDSTTEEEEPSASITYGWWSSADALRDAEHCTLLRRVEAVPDVAALLAALGFPMVTAGAGDGSSSDPCAPFRRKYKVEEERRVRAHIKSVRDIVVI